MVPYTALSPRDRQNVKSAAHDTYKEICRYFTSVLGPQVLEYPNWERDTKLITLHMAQKHQVNPLYVWAAFELVTPADDTPEVWAQETFSTFSVDAIPYMQ